MNWNVVPNSPPRIRRGGRDSKNVRSVLSGADGAVDQTRKKFFSGTSSTAPSAPIQGAAQYLSDVAATPPSPRRGIRRNILIHSQLVLPRPTLWWMHEN